MTYAPLRLKKDQERRLEAGHLWVYSNEVDTETTPLRNLTPGEPVEILSSRDRWMGYGYVNPNSLLCARLMSRQRKALVDENLIRARIQSALALRERIYPAPFYRLVFGEADGLPGLVVDRYGDVLALQITTAGMDRLRDSVVAALESLLQPKGILLRNDTQMRVLEGLPEEVSILRGEVPDQVEIQELGARFLVSPKNGQKTGWFYDQTDNRARLRRYLKGGRVLDVCSYLGGWGIQAALWGAEEVIGLDLSAPALDGMAENAALNGCGDRVRGIRGDAFEELRQLAAAQERFDLVILDPPAFIKRRKDLDRGVDAYLRLNRLGLQLLRPEGLLVTSSCSFHLPKFLFLRTVQKAAVLQNRHLQLLEAGQQSADHPVHPAIDETSYLKTLFLRVTNAT